MSLDDMIEKLYQNSKISQQQNNIQRIPSSIGLWNYKPTSSNLN